VGGKDPLGPQDFLNTVFVVGPEGEVVHKQAKCMPIQFFKDGQPAREQRLWRSPWGLLGLAICYDLSYTRVMDRLVSQGAQALIVPTMDVSDWGEHEHKLHGRVAPFRAAEYGLPVFRVASSGISQLIDERGRITAQGSFPGPQEVVSGELRLVQPKSLPADRTLAAGCAGVAFSLLALMVILAAWRTRIAAAAPNRPYQPC
jgi:apolipoprotein N-acyltransferase